MNRSDEMEATSTLSIVVATSIPPNVVRHENGRDVGHAYQRHCIESWIEAGFRVLSLNFPDEIPELAPCYPMVHFIAVNRDKSGMVFGHKTPLLSELLGVLSKQKEEIVGIINADIFLEAKDWTSVIRESVQGAIAVAHRADVTSCGFTDCTVYRYGYDLFFFERNEIPEDIPRPFALGLPWWDYWLPIAFIIRGLRVNMITSPIAFHLKHPTNFNARSFRYMCMEFAESILESIAARSGAIAPDLFPVIRLCRKLVSGPAIFEKVLPYLLVRAWGRVLGSIGHLPVFRKVAKWYYVQDEDRDRLVRVCVAAISSD
jgi:hypothetical protein